MTLTQHCIGPILTPHFLFSGDSTLIKMYSWVLYSISALNPTHWTSTGKNCHVTYFYLCCPMINSVFRLLTKTTMEFMAGFHYLPYSGSLIDPAQEMYLLVNSESFLSRPLTSPDKKYWTLTDYTINKLLCTLTRQMPRGYSCFILWHSEIRLYFSDLSCQTLMIVHSLNQ